MNTSKTEHTIVQRSLTAQSNWITRAKDEDWRITRKLGSLLGDAEVVSRCKNLATAALHRMWKVWPLQMLRIADSPLQLRDVGYY